MHVPSGQMALYTYVTIKCFRMDDYFKITLSSDSVRGLSLRVPPAAVFPPLDEEAAHVNYYHMFQS